jgi:hypothetical protein
MPVYLKLQSCLVVQTPLHAFEFKYVLVICSTRMYAPCCSVDTVCVCCVWAVKPRYMRAWLINRLCLPMQPGCVNSWQWFPPCVPRRFVRVPPDNSKRRAIISKSEVTLRLTVSQSVSQSVCLGIEYPCGTCDQILFSVGMLLSEICGLVSLWREDGSAICSVITQWC